MNGKESQGLVCSGERVASCGGVRLCWSLAYGFSAISLIPTPWTWLAVPRSCLSLLPPPHDGSSTARRGLLDGSSISFQAIIVEYDGSSTAPRRLVDGSSTDSFLARPAMNLAHSLKQSSQLVETIIILRNIGNHEFHETESHQAAIYSNGLNEC